MLAPDSITASDVKQRIDSGEPIVFLDARAPDAWDSATHQIAGAVRIRPSEVENHLRLVPQGHPIVAYCTCPHEMSSQRAAEALVYNGWKNVHPLRGGFKAAEEAGLPTEPKRGDSAP